MKINSANLGNFSLANLFQFTKRLIELVEENDAEKLKIAPQFNNLLLPAFEKFDAAYKKGQKSEFTEKIVTLDKSRDRIMSGISGIVNAMSKNINYDLAESAKRVKIILDKYKRITSKSFNAQSADTVNMLQEFKGKYTDDVEKLGLIDWIDELENVNNEINSYMKIRDKETAEKSKNDVIESKKEVIAAYRMLCKQIEVLVATEGSANYSDFILNLNAIIKKSGGKSTSATPSSETPVIPEEKYPNAREWGDLNADEWKNGDICFVVVGGKKKYYELIDIFHIDIDPTGEEGSVGWREIK